MITVIVRFPLPQGISPEDVKKAYEHSAPQFREAPRLVRKYYLHGANRSRGGVYLWDSREAAEVMYSNNWGSGLPRALVLPRRSSTSTRR